VDDFVLVHMRLTLKRSSAVRRTYRLSVADSQACGIGTGLPIRDAKEAEEPSAHLPLG